MTTDEQTTPLVRSWLRSTAGSRHTTSQTVAEVMTRLPQTRQRGRWWPLPTFRRKAQTSTATDTTDYRPSPIPATNGRAPTVIGRTQTMFSPVKAITAGALVFAIGGLFLIAQPFDQQGGVPGAEQGAELARPVVVTITASGGDDVYDCEGCFSSGEAPEIGHWLLNAVEWSASDPRLSGTADYRVNERTWVRPSGDRVSTVFEAYAVELVSDKGAWVGTGRYVGPLDLYVLTLTGEGEYEGLAAVVTEDTSAADDIWADEEDIWNLKATIVEGGLPAFPEPAE